MNNWFSPPVDGEISLDAINEMAENGNFHEWNFEPFEAQENGYEDVLDEIKKYRAVDYLALEDKYKKAVEAGKTAEAEEIKVKMGKMVDDVLMIYREKDILPIQYFSDFGIMDEIEKCIAYKAKFDGNTVSCGAGIGTTLCNYLFPNIFDTPSAHDLEKTNARSLYEKFHNDEYLRRAIKFCYSYKDGCPVPTNVMGGLRLVGSAPTNFRPMNAKAVYERFCPAGGVIYDYCCGFGGRMLGALTSKNGYHYVGTDPCTETFYHLNQLGEWIESVTGREDSYELHCCGSEVFCGPEESVDFAFSSPPYFNLEVYSDEETQCYNKFPELDQWLEGYVRQTIKNIYHMLKPGALYAVNIADFKVGSGREVAYVDEWKRISAEEGMPLFDTVYLGVTSRAGSAEQAAGELKKENIMIFKKPM